MAGEVEKLAQALRDEEDKHAAEADAKKAELATLKELLRRLKQDTMLTLRFARKEAAAKTESMSRGYGADEEEVEAGIEELRARIATEMLVHEQSMSVLKTGKGYLQPFLVKNNDTDALDSVEWFYVDCDTHLTTRQSCLKAVH